MKKTTSSPVAAFTLVELLVSMAVLTLLLVMIVQLMNSATTATTGSRKRLDADGQARLIFDRMANDFAKMLKRKDVDYVFNKQNGNDNLFFFSEAPGFFSSSTNKSTASLVGYRINTNNAFYANTPVLERLGKGLAWDGATAGSSPGSMVFLTYPTASPSPAASPTPDPSSTLNGNWPTVVNDTSADGDFHVIGDQIYRLEFCFVLTDGTTSNKPYLAANTGINGLQDVSAVIVALAILDSTSQKIVTDRSKMVDALLDPTDANLQASPPQLMAQTWTTALNSSTFAQTTGLPQTAASQVRIYQRYFYLNK